MTPFNESHHVTRESHHARSVIRASIAGTAIALLASGPASAVTITSFAATTGRAPDPPYCAASIIMIQGSGFINDGGVTQVTIGGTQVTSFVVSTDNVLLATVAAGTKTGPISVTTPLGTATTSTVETIAPCESGPPTTRPNVTKAPATAKGGKRIQLLGTGFVGITSVTVGGINATYAIPSDQNLYVIIPAGARNGKLTIKLTSPAGSASITLVKTH